MNTMFVDEIEMEPLAAQPEPRRREASSVIVQEIAPEQAEQFRTWRREMTKAARAFAGYRATEIYPPAAGHPRHWVIAVRFDDRKSLDAWLQSPAASQWISRLNGRPAGDQLPAPSKELEPRFARQPEPSVEAAPPRWKTAMTMLLGLYPTVMLLWIFGSPYTGVPGMALSMLIGLAASVLLLQWIVMPAVNNLLRPWLSTRGRANLPATIAGAVTVAGMLLAMMLVARNIIG